MTDDRQMAAARVAVWAKQALGSADSRAHGWLHTLRVRRNILILAEAESVDLVLAELAALLHDIGRTQPGPECEHGARSAAIAQPLLADLPLSSDEQAAVLHAIRWHNSGRGDTQLLCILRDADMLDGLGAIGIIRAYMSRSHLAPYEPEAPFSRERAKWPARYSSDQLFGQMDWFEKLNTDTAREMALDRIAFMEAFVAQAQWELMSEDN